MKQQFSPVGRPLNSVGRPLTPDVRTLDTHHVARWRRQIILARTIAPEFWFSERLHGYRLRQTRLVRALHDLLLDHHGLCSRLVVYTHLPRYIPAQDHERYLKLSMGKKRDPRYLNQLRQTIWEAKRCGLIDVVNLPEGSGLGAKPPGRACAQCGLHLSPGDIEAQRSQAPCPGPATAADVAAEQGGRASDQR